MQLLEKCLKVELLGKMWDICCLMHFFSDFPFVHTSHAYEHLSPRTENVGIVDEFSPTVHFSEELQHVL